MSARYVHTNIIAKDWKKLSFFYQKVFGCKPLPPERDLSGEWMDSLTGINQVHVQGEHLLLPGYGEDHPTLEIFSYNEMQNENSKRINNIGIAHLAFEVDDVRKTLEEVMREGGGKIGDVVETIYPNNKKAIFVYATDIEGNIIELQSWEELNK